jgi:2Fe-2S ferredoxin
LANPCEEVIMGTVTVVDVDGERRGYDAVEGWRVMEILREHGLPIAGTCDGASVCGTCHVRVAADWTGRIAPANDDEEATLDTLPNAGPGSRLGCQIIYEAALDGLEVMIAGDGFVDGDGI